MVCDACDGDHGTENCPYFKLKRSAHLDATSREPGEVGGVHDGNFWVQFAQVDKQDGDGACMFHSLSWLEDNETDHLQMRAAICKWLLENASTTITGTLSVSKWIRWDSDCSVEKYVQNMGQSGEWGGAIELASFVRCFETNVHVYEKMEDGSYLRIARFDADPNTNIRTVHVLFTPSDNGRSNHYDALKIEAAARSGV